MRLRLPSSLHYPITVTELLKRGRDHVDKGQPLFAYYYKTPVTEGNRFGEEHEVLRTYPSRYESPVEGVLKAWMIEPGTVIASDHVEVADIEEPCPHSVQFGGMCTLCGKDMTELSYNTDIVNADRATINMIHDNNALTVSADEATRVEEEAKRRLLRAKKLSLVVDLDQTIIHATVDPTVAEWQRDADNPNHGAVRDVRAFQLVDDGPGGRGCWYYIKLRPGLAAFLEQVSRLYELHIYTMGTRAYARHIAAIVDPDRRVFGDRILSRDESGSLTAKNLQRLFPVDTKMVVIIDDRGDVWKWSDNLIKVTPYDFFVGIGDINSSFLPKKQPDLAPPAADPTKTLLDADPDDDATEAASADRAEPTADESGGRDAPASAEPSPSQRSDVSALDQLVSMGGGDDPNVMQEQASRQDETLAAQLQDRPLLQQQKRLDAEDDAAAACVEQAAERRAGDEPQSEPAPHRQNLLRDGDTELQHLERSLREVHRAFFEEYDRKLAKAPGGRIAELRGDRNAKKAPPAPEANADLEAVPDVKTILPLMKLRVLEGVVLVLSGVVPLGADIQRYARRIYSTSSRADLLFSSDIATWATSFGARISLHINKHTTHVVAARNRTAKVRQAARIERIKIVNTQWLLDSISQWKRLDEDGYLIPVHPEDREGGRNAFGEKDGELTADENSGLSSSSDDGERDNDGDDDNATDEIDDPDGVLPADLEGNVSPVEGFMRYDWKEIDDDLADFLGSDDESESESVASASSRNSTSPRKRKRSRSRSASGSVTDGGEPPARNGDSAEDLSGSRLAKRQQLARARTTTLKAVATTADNGSSLPSPETTGGEQEGERFEGDDDEADEDLNRLDDFDLEREIEAEIEKEFGADLEAR
ncbi:MAG: Carboxy-terminal domain (CTD) phosphatase [Thelocarpon impressellum]|nr:MAG: Carboxy-terminal domain (CTD) phosphatase [Thelocarpon impressellum]